MRMENYKLGDRFDDDAAGLNELCAHILSQRRLILVSNRGPVEHQMTAGQPEPRRGSGSVVTSFSPLAQGFEFTWVSSAMSEGDRTVSGNGAGLTIKSPLPGHQINLRYVTTPRRAYHKYYNVICNPLLWFLQHYMWNPPHNPTVDANVHDAWETGYVAVNEAFAKAVVSEARSGDSPPVVLGHDYHLYLLPEFVRRDLPDAIIQHYVHVPWPTPLYWNLIPRHIVRRICESLCAADIVGFQTAQDRRCFLDTVEEFVPESRVDRTSNTVELHGQICSAEVYPGSINVDEVQHIAGAPRTLEYEARLKRDGGEATIVRIDRAEPNKNIVRGFRAYEQLLSEHPELKGRVKFLAFLVPSRTHLRQYQRYMDEVQQVIQQVNNAHGSNGWQPIVPYMENNYAQAIAGMKLYDALLVNTLVEGMNLVAKEGPVVNKRDGVLVLSQSSGAYRQLAEGALSVAPTDVVGTSRALYQAITMPAEERKQRAALLYGSICRHDNEDWLCRQLQDIAALL
jgi:trehalose 6-phosphate synthase